MAEGRPLMNRDQVGRGIGFSEFCRGEVVTTKKVPNQVEDWFGDSLKAKNSVCNRVILYWVRG